MPKLLILPGATHVLGGTLVSLSQFLQGVEICAAKDKVKVLAPSGSFLEKYLNDHGKEHYLQLIEADTDAEFVRKSLQWLAKQPSDWALLMDNCVSKELIPILVFASISLRLSQRPVYFFFHDLALSYNPVGYLLRKFIFAVLNPASMCNSKFTADHIKQFVRDIRGILYQPVDFNKFKDLSSDDLPPSELKAILESNCQIMLTPSRLNKPGIVNDKNLRALIPVLATLKAMGYNYHGVVIGEDTSADGSHTKDLKKAAADMGIADRFTILPPTLNIQAFYKFSDVVVTLAPREPFGRIVVEAIACGTPVVGSNSGGIGEILSHFAPQWTVDPEKPVEVAKTIIRVTEDENSPRLFSKGKEWVEKECSIVEYARQILLITGIDIN